MDDVGLVLELRAASIALKWQARARIAKAGDVAHLVRWSLAQRHHWHLERLMPGRLLLALVGTSKGHLPALHSNKAWFLGMHCPFVCNYAGCRYIRQEG